jgi:hypothetical protein
MRTLNAGVYALCAVAFAALSIASTAAGSGTRAPVPHSGSTPVANPRDATFIVEGERVALRDGRAERPAAPGSASVTRTQLLGGAVYGDIDRDGDSDALFWLVQDGGGSGTFYYVVSALRVDGGYLGSNAMFIGDRIVPKRLDVLHGVGVVEYLERAPDQPMTAPAETWRGAWFGAEDVRLTIAGTLGPGEQVVAGRVRFGHEVRSVEPCTEPGSYWLMGDSPALAAVQDTLRQAAAGAEPWPPQLMVLAGRRTAPPHDGFGADYDAGWQVMQVIRVAPGAECRGDQIVRERPMLDRAPGSARTRAADAEALPPDQSPTDPHALWLGRNVLAIADAIRHPESPDAMAAVLALGHDSRYYVMVRGWLAMQLTADMSILEAGQDDVSPLVVARIAFLRDAIRAIDLE